MKIALVHKRLDLSGGTERVFYRTAEGLCARGHEVHLFCGAFAIPAPQGALCHRVPYLRFCRTVELVSFAFTVPRVLARYPCEVVMSFNRLPRQDIFRSGGGPHRAFLEKMIRQAGPWRRAWYRLSLYHRSVLAIEKRQLGPKGCSKVIAVSRQGKREMMDCYGLPDHKVVVIHNGVDHRRFHPDKRLTTGRDVRQELGIPVKSPVVLFVGTGFRRKGLDRVLGLWSSADLDGIYLLVVGADANLSYYRKRWRHPRILFVGPQRVVENYYAAANVFVLPSTQEAFGNAVLEALASGLPVVTVPEVGATDKIEGLLKEGMLVDRDDPVELKQKILEMLDEKRWKMLSEEARRVSEKYSWESYFSALEGELAEAASHRTERGARDVTVASRARPVDVP